MILTNSTVYRVQDILMFNCIQIKHFFRMWYGNRIAISGKGLFRL